MWKTEVSIADLRYEGRWKADFFRNSTQEYRGSTFPLTPLGDIVTVRRETMDPQVYPDSLLNYIGLENIETGTGDLVGFKQKYGREIRSRSKEFQAGDLLYGRLRPYLNKVFLAEGSITEGICSGEFHVLTPRQHQVLPNFLRAILSSDYVQQQVVIWQTGSALPRLLLEDLLRTKVPLPTLEEQKIYEGFLSSQNDLRKRLKEDAAMLETGTAKVFMDALERGTVPSIVNLTSALHGATPNCRHPT